MDYKCTKLIDLELCPFCGKPADDESGHVACPLDYEFMEQMLAGDNRLAVLWNRRGGVPFSSLADEYKTNKELTAFTALDGEKFL